MATAARAPVDWTPRPPAPPAGTPPGPSTCAGWRADDGPVEGLDVHGELPLDDAPPGVTLAGGRVTDARAAGGRLERWRLRDLVVAGSSLAGVSLRDGGAERVSVVDSRLSGLVWARGRMRDVSVAGTRADGMALRSCVLRRVRFSDCLLSGLDLVGSTLEGVEFRDCAITEADLRDLSVAGARFIRCDLSGATGASRLRDSQVDLDTAMTLTVPLAREAGLRLLEG